MTNRCSTCKQYKPVENFNKNRSNKTGLHNQCRECQKLWKPSPEALAISRQKTREWNRKKVSGFTPEDFKNKLTEQEGKCAVCGTSDSGPTDWHADHDHKTGQKRGVLCHKCNTGLGLFNDNTDTLERAIMYLNQYNSINNEVTS